MASYKSLLTAAFAMGIYLMIISDSFVYAEEYNPCAATTCLEGAECCLEREICNNKTCPLRAYCSAPGKCDYCAAVVCEEGTICCLEKVYCKKAPCPPRTSCVAPTECKNMY
ncbi:hypothetical protein C0J52_17114 [Blattella germanica]|nr:hypothetical protein C0J52_17114 [Blattella germanica]